MSAPAMDVNVEDLNIEHSPGQLSALITLALSHSDADKLSSHLSSIGWNVHPIRKLESRLITWA
jgi:prephenate dehydrogenase